MNNVSSDPLLSETQNGGVLTLRLGAGKAHALSLAMIHALQDRLDRLKDDETVRAVILHGEGSIFCAGHDLKEMRRHRDDYDEGRAYVNTLFRDCARMMTTLTRLPQPTIALVEGIATAGGLQLMCSCDLTFAAEGARFCLPGVNNGGFCTTPAVAVGRKLGRNALAEMALSGETFDAEWALRNGLINRIYPQGQLHAATDEFAEKLASRHAPAMQAGKAMMYRQLDMPLEQAYAEATEVMIDHFMDPVRIKEERETW